MMEIKINGKTIEVSGQKSILSAALEAGVYIPHLCYHPQVDSSAEILSVELAYQNGLPHHGKQGAPFQGCNLCLVEIDGREGLLQSCKTMSEEGMSISTDSEALRKARDENIARIFETHPHACVVCAQAAGCDRKCCSVHIPESERCCSRFGNCELQKVAEFIGIKKGLPPYVPPPKTPLADNEPLIDRDYDLCIGCLRCVRTCKEIKRADALCFTMQDGRVVVGSKGSTLKESGCHFCGFCVEVCPTGALADKDFRTGKRVAQLVPCRSQCPAEIDVPSYVRFIAEGKYAEAAAVIRERVPFPSVLGRVCFHPCETVCRRGSLDQPVAICALKRAAAELDELSYRQLPGKAKTGRKVAVIGSGPAGLTAAYYLNMLGHSVTVFESLQEAGGMLRVGIPAYRLQRQTLDREIRAIEDAGVEIKTGSPVVSLDKVLADGFQAVFVATGAHKGVALGIPGQDMEGVVDGVSFLRKASLDRREAVGDRVAVIGGGNVALDAARTAIRLGGKDVTVFYRRTCDEMPAHDEEIEAALEEGVKIEYQVGSKAIEKVEGGLNVLFVRMEMGNLDESGRHRPVPLQGSEYTLPFDAVITAIGQNSGVPEGVVIAANTARNRLAVELESAKGIFVGGDLLTGPRTVIDAIAGGRQAAVLIDKFLGGDGDISQVFTDPQSDRPLAAVQSIYVDHKRALMPMLPIDERIINFHEVNCGYDRQTAVAEAKRCLGCDLRFQIKPAVMPPERYLILAQENIQDIPQEGGVYRLYDARKEVYKISGVENLRQALSKECEAEGGAQYFDYEEDPMFTMKERQLVQQYMQKSGVMPRGNDELDDLF